MGFAPDFCDIHGSGQKPLQVSAFRAVAEPFERRKWGRERPIRNAPSSRSSVSIGLLPEEGQSAMLAVRSGLR